MKFTKSQVMEMVAAGKIDESFVHESGLTVNITWLRKLAEAQGKKPICIALTVDLLEIVRNHRDVDIMRVFSLPEKSVHEDPIMFIDMKDGSHMLIDGSHRMLARAVLGFKTLRAFVFTMEEAESSIKGCVDAGIDWGSEKFNKELRAKINGVLK